jgi:hypothetical protein
MLKDFYHTGKIQRLRPGLNPRTGVPEASMPSPVSVNGENMMRKRYGDIKTAVN